MSEWKVGARAEIMVSEHPNNAGRIVTLKQGFWRNRQKHWAVEDGKPFTAYDPKAHISEPLDARDKTTEMILGIEQWKLRLCDD